MKTLSDLVIVVDHVITSRLLYQMCIYFYRLLSDYESAKLPYFKRRILFSFILFGCRTSALFIEEQNMCDSKQITDIAYSLLSYRCLFKYSLGNNSPPLRFISTGTIQFANVGACLVTNVVMKYKKLLKWYYKQRKRQNPYTYIRSKLHVFIYQLVNPEYIEILFPFN